MHFVIVKVFVLVLIESVLHPMPDILQVVVSLIHNNIACTVRPIKSIDHAVVHKAEYVHDIYL